jgi:hypothetical protein
VPLGPATRILEVVDPKVNRLRRLTRR